MSNINQLSSRTILFITIGILFIPITVVILIFPEVYIENEFLIDQAVFLISYMSILFALWAVIHKRRLFMGSWPGRCPDRRSIWFYLGLSVPMVGMAIICIMVVYWPLSFVAPAFVESWILEEPPSIVFKSDWRSVLGSVLSVLLIVLIAPVTEEIVFRWLLIERWKSKYSTSVAIILSSIVFSILHADLLGSFLFGVLLSLIYLHTGSLWGPILVHIGNNVIATVLMVIDEFWLHIPKAVEEFQSDWLVPLIGLLLILPWLPMAVRRKDQAKAILEASGRQGVTTSKVEGL